MYCKMTKKCKKAKLCLHEMAVVGVVLVVLAYTVSMGAVALKSVI